MYDVCAVGVINGIAYRASHGDGDFGNFGGVIFDEVGEGWPVDEFHDEELGTRVIVFSGVVDFDDVWVMKFCDGFGFSFEAFGAFGL